MWWTMRSFLKFTCSEKATKFCKISTYNLSNVLPVKWLVEISQNVAALSEYMNFNYQEYNQPHQHLCTVHESLCIRLEEVSPVRLPKFHLKPKLYILSTLNINFIFWQQQWVLAVVKYEIMDWIMGFFFRCSSFLGENSF